MGLNLSFEKTDSYLDIGLCGPFRKHLSIANVYTSHDKIDAAYHPFITLKDHIFGDEDQYVVCKLDLEAMSSQVRAAFLGTYPPDDDEASGYSLDNAWEAMEYRESIDAYCKRCPLCPNENFEQCYPRMGSYGYVASLHDFASATNDYQLLANEFVVRTRSGGFRLEPPDPSGHADLYERLVLAIRQCREHLRGLSSEALVFYRNGEACRSFHGASPARNSIGAFDWFLSSGGLSWGVHIGKGIACVRGVFPHESPTYYQRLYRQNGHMVGERMGGGEDVFESVTLLQEWDGTEYDEARFVTDKPALARFGHLLDTAETALELALKYNLVLQEC